MAANLQMKKETLKDMAKPILTEDQIEFRRQEVTEIQQLIAGLRDKKNPLLEEKEELRDLIEKALVYHMVSCKYRALYIYRALLFYNTYHSQ